MMGGHGLAEVLSDFDGYMSRGIPQGNCTKAPMIRPEFGKISFANLRSDEIIKRQNALFGGNTKPHFNI